MRFFRFFLFFFFEKFTILSFNLSHSSICQQRPQIVRLFRPFLKMRIFATFWRKRRLIEFFPFLILTSWPILGFNWVTFIFSISGLKTCDFFDLFQKMRLLGTFCDLLKKNVTNRLSSGFLRSFLYLLSIFIIHIFANLGLRS